MEQRPFGEHLRRFRLEVGLTQESLAEAAKMSVYSISNLERGVAHRPRGDTICRLADALDLSPQQREALLLAATHLAPRASGPVPIPHIPDPVCGRDVELAELMQLWQTSAVRLLTITGIGGVGKTRLALELAHRIAPHGEQRAFIELASLTASASLLAVFGQALGVHEIPRHPLLDQIRQILAHGTWHLLVDNLEHLPEIGQFISLLLTQCPQVRIIATSRTPLHIRGEYLYPLVPLRVPQLDRRYRAEELMQISSIALLVQRIQQLRPDFRVTDSDIPALAAICHRLEGLPLALELAAARTNVLSLTTLLARLDHRLDILTLGHQEVPQRQQTLRATLAWSYHLLTRTEQYVLRVSVVFVNGITVYERVSMCDLTHHV